MDLIKYKLSLLNKINHYQLALINEIKHINILGNIDNINDIVLYIINIYNINNIIDINYKYILNNDIIINNNKNNNICIIYYQSIWYKYNLQNIISKYDKVLFVIDETNSKIYESFSNYINLYHNMIIIKYEYNTKYLISNVKNIDIILDKKY
jgi:hypothetical protein